MPCNRLNFRSRPPPKPLTDPNSPTQHTHQTSLRELWALLNFLLPDVFDQTAEDIFSRCFNIGIEKRVDQAMLAKAHALLQPFMLRRLKVASSYLLTSDFRGGCVHPNAIVGHKSTFNKPNRPYTHRWTWSAVSRPASRQR